jgi:hypothetical protein
VAVTLADIERAVMGRTGPFEEHEVSADVASTTSLVRVDAVKSTLSLGGYKGMYLLRRGVKTDGTLISGFEEGDRQRRIKSFTPGTGTLEVDRVYEDAPVAGEAIEVCALNPTQVIRRATLAGLRRAKVENRVEVRLRGVAAERSLTASLPWLTEKRWIKGVSYKETGSVYDPVPVRWFSAFMKAGEVWLSISPDPYPNRLYVTVNMPAYYWVNGAWNPDGPTADDDTLPLTLEHAAAAGHIEVWRIAGALLKPLAEQKLTASQEDAAMEFTRQNRRVVTRARPRWQLNRPLHAVTLP